jgi:hypothetical protein
VGVLLIDSASFVEGNQIKMNLIKEVDFPYPYFNPGIVFDIDGDGSKELILEFYQFYRGKEKYGSNHIAIFDLSSDKAILKAKTKDFGEKTVQLIGITHNPKSKKKNLLVRIDDKLRWCSVKDSKFVIEAELRMPIKGNIRFIEAGYLTNKELEDMVFVVAVKPAPAGWDRDWITKEVIFSWDGKGYKKVWETKSTHKHQLLFIRDIDRDGVNEFLIQTGEGPVVQGIEIYKWCNEGLALFYKSENIFDNYDIIPPHIITGNFDSSKGAQIILSGALTGKDKRNEITLYKWNSPEKKMDKHVICSTCFPYPMMAGDIDNDGIDELFIFEQKKIKIYKLTL